MTIRARALVAGVLAAALFITAGTASAVETKNLGDYDREGFGGGEKDAVYVDLEGNLALAPERRSILQDVEHAWCVAAGKDGTVYAGTVPEGKVYRIKDGQAEVLFETGEAGVFSLAVLADGTVVAGTGSEGRIFTVGADGAGELVAKVEENYVFGLAVGKSGELFAATGGGKGRIYRIAGGEAELLYDSPSEHLMALAVGAGGEIYAGSGDRGAVYEVGRDGKGKVLFSAPEGIIQDVAVGDEGNVYAATAAIGEAKPGVEESVIRAILGRAKASNSDGPASPTPSAPPAKRKYKVSNFVYRIRPTGEVRKVFKVEGALVLTVATDGERLLVGTGGKAGIYEVDTETGDEAVLFETESDHVHDVVVLAGGGIVAGLGTGGEVVRLGKERSRKGSFESRVFQAGELSRWGDLSWRGALPKGTQARFEVRSGNAGKPDSTWTDWQEVEAGGGQGATRLTASRYMQYRVELMTASGEVTPRIKEVSIAALGVNLPPVVSEITAGQAQARGRAGGQPAAKSATGNGGNGAKSGKREALSGMAEISWKAADPNKDKLVYEIWFRLEGLDSFVKLEDELSESKYRWDTRTAPDGEYYFRVTASDAASNVDASALTASKVEGPFTVDNTGPLLGEVTVRSEGGGRTLTVEATDAASPVAEAFSSVDGGKWEPVLPEDGIFDSKSERISVRVTKEDAAIVVIRSADSAGNTSVAKVILEGER